MYKHNTIYGASLNPEKPSDKVINSSFYQRTITLSQSTNPSNRQIQIGLTTGNFNYSNIDANGFGMRFYQSDGTELKHWIEVWNPSGNSFIWVKTVSNVSSIIMRYTTETISDVGNIETTFDFGDEFIGDISGWTTFNSVTHDSINETMDVNYTGSESEATINPPGIGQIQDDKGIQCYGAGVDGDRPYWIIFAAETGSQLQDIVSGSSKGIAIATQIGTQYLRISFTDESSTWSNAVNGNVLGSNYTANGKVFLYVSETDIIVKVDTNGDGIYNYSVSYNGGGTFEMSTDLEVVGTKTDGDSGYMGKIFIHGWNIETFITGTPGSETESIYDYIYLNKDLFNFKTEFDFKLNKIAGNGALLYLSKGNIPLDADENLIILKRYASNQLRWFDQKTEDWVGATISIEEGATAIRFKIIRHFFGRTPNTNQLTILYKNITDFDTDWNYLVSFSPEVNFISHILYGSFDYDTDLELTKLIIREVSPLES